MMTRRGQFRNLKVTLDPDLAKVYLDEDLNVKFGSFHLQEMVVGGETAGPSVESKQADEKKRTLQSITKDMVCEKFGAKGTIQNAKVWLKLFNSECDRLQVKEDQRSEAMRLFMENSPLEWFMAEWKITERILGWNGQQDFWIVLVNKDGAKLLMLFHTDGCVVRTVSLL